MVILLIIGLIGLILCLYIFIRNHQVYYITTSWDNLLFNELGRILNTYKDNNDFHKDENNYYNITKKIYSLLDKHSYNEYLYSFKPLKLEKWFTKEEIEFMKYLKQYRK